MKPYVRNFFGASLFAVVGGLAFNSAAFQGDVSGTSADKATVRDFGAVGDGKADDTAAIQRAVDSGTGAIRFPKGVFRITKPIVVDLDKVGFTSFAGDGVGRVVMAGPGPAIRFIGTHAGTADPNTVKDNVWESQRMPAVDGLEIVGAHPDACGIEASGTMQLTLTRVCVRKALHAVHLTGRNRNVTLSECHLYENHGIGVFMDRLNLHQVNIANCHISYNAGGGVVVQQSEVRNLQIGTCDIEGNMGGPGSAPTANILIDSTGASVAEVAIVGCTIQHAHDAPDSTNIRYLGESTPRPYTDELRHGYVTIANNVMSDVQVNVEIENARGVAITGNTIWKGYDRNLIVEGSSHVVVSNNVFDRNPRYYYGDGASARLGLIFADSTDCTISGNHVQGVGDADAAIVLQRCERMNVNGCTILNYGPCGLLLEDVSDSRVSDCLIRDTEGKDAGVALRVSGGGGNMIVDNMLDTQPEVDGDTNVVRGSLVKGATAKRKRDDK